MRLTKRLVGLAFAATLASAACGGGGDSANPSPSGLPAATFTTTSAPTATPANPVRTATSTAAPASPTAAVSTATSSAAPTSPPAASAPPPTATAPPSPSAASVTVTAENLVFDRAVIRVKVGAAVTATLINKDVGVDHNLTFSLPGLGHPTCPGPCTTSQTFTPAQAGPFSFFCTLHATMFGDFIVE